MRFMEPRALEYGFARGASRAIRRRPRALLYSEDYPTSAPGPEWLLFSAFSSKFAPGRLVLGPYRLLQGRVRW